MIYGQENVAKRVLLDLTLIDKAFDLCGDSKGPSIILANRVVHDGYLQLSKRGVTIRHITEITKDNLSDCKQMLAFCELRHLDGLKGYFGIADSKIFASFAFGEEGKAPPHELRSTVKQFVEQQQYFYETLWRKAIPAGQRIREIEEGQTPETTEIVSGLDAIFQRLVTNFSRAKDRVDSCCDDKAPPMVVKSS